MKMKKTGFFLLFFLSCTILIHGQGGNYIRMVVPEKDTVSVFSANQRLNGSTEPGSTVTINHETCKVYATGAFAGFYPLKPGKNELLIESVHPEKGKATLNLVINCRAQEPEKAVEKFGIEYGQVVPRFDQTLITGDVIQVRMKAQSGNKAIFLGNKPMYELPAGQTGGPMGIYQGTYQFTAADTLKETKIDFTLIGKTGELATAFSGNKVSVNSGGYPLTGRTTGIFPYLNYGLGTDRLGGARISYLDTMVLLELSGKTGDLYQVKLSKTQFAWIPSEYVILMPKGTFAPFSMMDSWSVSGDEKYDYVKIGLTERLPYISKYEISPARIVLDIYGAVSNTNWITQLNSTREISNVYYEQPEKNVVRVFIELKHSQPWGYAVYYEKNWLVVRVKQQPARLSLANMAIGLDAGHGGPASGAVGSTGVREKDINLAVVMKVKDALEKAGARVILTRTGDENLSTTQRWQMWQKAEPDLVLSFHCNSVGNSDPLKVKGTSTYYKYVAFRRLSLILYDEMLKTGLSEFGNVGSFNFTLNAPTDFPNALIEMAFLSNPEDEMLLLDDRFRDKIVKGVLTGLRRYLKDCR